MRKAKINAKASKLKPDAKGHCSKMSTEGTMINILIFQGQDQDQSQNQCAKNCALMPYKK